MFFSVSIDVQFSNNANVFIYFVMAFPLSDARAGQRFSVRTKSRETTSAVHPHQTLMQKNHEVKQSALLIATFQPLSRSY